MIRIKLTVLLKFRLPNMQRELRTIIVVIIAKNQIVLARVAVESDLIVYTSC
jgi:hypothetical protein